MAKTIVGLMGNIDDARRAVRELVQSGIDRNDIGFMANQRHAIPDTAELNEGEGSHAGSGALAGAGLGAVAGGLMGGLARLGVPENEAQYYAEAVRRGGILVTVAADSEAQADMALTLLRRHGAVDIDERATEWKKQGWKGRFEAAPERRVSTAPYSGRERRRAA